MVQNLHVDNYGSLSHHGADILQAILYLGEKSCPFCIFFSRYEQTFYSKASFSGQYVSSAGIFTSSGAKISERHHQNQRLSDSDYYHLQGTKQRIEVESSSNLEVASSAFLAEMPMFPILCGFYYLDFVITMPVQS